MQIITALNLLFSGLAMSGGVAAAFFTYHYVRLTKELVTETRKLRKLNNTPKICLNITLHDQYTHIFNLEITNIGLGLAYDIDLTLKEDFNMTNEMKLGELGLFQTGIKYLAPSQRISTFLTNALDDWASLKSKIISITVFYKNSSSENFEETFNLAFSHFDGMTSLGTPPQIAISE